MKKAWSLFLVVMIGAATNVLAVDIMTLDRVHVLMPQAQVFSLLGSPDEITRLGGGMNVDVYRVVNAMPLIQSGCLYDEGRLVGQSFVFQGNSSKEIAERLRKWGFTLLEGGGSSLRLVGRDDDTGQPLVAIITENDDLTTITTFEKGFYDRRMQ